MPAFNVPASSSRPTCVRCRVTPKNLFVVEATGHARPSVYGHVIFHPRPSPFSMFPSPAQLNERKKNTSRGRPGTEAGYCWLRSGVHKHVKVCSDYVNYCVTCHDYKASPLLTPDIAILFTPEDVQCNHIHVYTCSKGTYNIWLFQLRVFRYKGLHTHTHIFSI